MPVAICNNGHLTLWSNPRGTKLADMRCVGSAASLLWCVR